MRNWVYKGLATGIRTTAYPAGADHSPGISPGRPRATKLATHAAETLEKNCPTHAISAQQTDASVDYRHCVHCSRCRQDSSASSMDWEGGFEWGALAEQASNAGRRFEKAFGHSLHIRFVDAGACGGCMSEARQLNNPYYNIHRLGFFITPTPREADILLVAGPVTDAMHVPLLKSYLAMPEPKRVVAMGVCAISGGVFGPSFISAGGVADVIPVDVMIPGCPPPPLAILHGLLLVVERTKPASLMSTVPSTST
ncbi:MAG: NADH:ubiquinone oxidoreductase [Gammaproteobacteria bacterium]